MTGYAILPYVKARCTLMLQAFGQARELSESAVCSAGYPCTPDAFAALYNALTGYTKASGSIYGERVGPLPVCSGLQPSSIGSMQSPQRTLTAFVARTLL